MSSFQTRRVVIFSGGSAANSLVDVFHEVSEKNNCALTYVIPISDNGGSSSELIRVFGGPGIGDVRSMKFDFLVLSNGLESLQISFFIDNKLTSMFKSYLMMADLEAVIRLAVQLLLEKSS